VDSDRTHQTHAAEWLSDQAKHASVKLPELRAAHFDRPEREPRIVFTHAGFQTLLQLGGA
jgi:hypothetical protein